MRLGGHIAHEYHSPEQWLREVRDLGYSAVIFPVDSTAPLSVQDEYLACIKENDLVIGEVGVWRNLFDPDPSGSAAALDYSIEQLALAERVGARCCVNISGSFNPDCWDGYHPLNYAEETYDKVVDMTRKIIDAGNPINTKYTLEPMPWMSPDSPGGYLKLLDDVDREGFGVHLDFANMINSVELWDNSSHYIGKTCFDLLGRYICSVHIKDVKLTNDLPCCLLEALPGEGGLDLGIVLRHIEELGEDTPAFVEHLSSHEEYARAVGYLRGLAKEVGVVIK